MAELHLRLHMGTPDWATPVHTMYRVGLEMAAWADAIGFDAIRIGEHHGTEDNFCPAPVAFASAVAAVTRRIRVRLSAYLLPLHHPLRAAEELAVLDLVSAGRLEVLIGAGYRAEEFEMFGVDRGERGRLVEEGVAILRRAWRGEPFRYRDRRVQVRPLPHQPGGPPLELGGSSTAAARRAVRLGLGFLPTSERAFDAYQMEREARGLPPARPLPRTGPYFVHVANDVEAAWARIARHVLYEANEYAAWLATDSSLDPVSHGERATSIDALRARGQYVVVTPVECADLIRELGPGGVFTLHPLISGLDPETAWASLRLFEREVLPALGEVALSPSAREVEATGLPPAGASAPSRPAPPARGPFLRTAADAAGPPDCSPRMSDPASHSGG